MNYTLFRHLEFFGFLIDIKIKIDQFFKIILFWTMICFQFFL